jgi:hypothetical protein
MTDGEVAKVKDHVIRRWMAAFLRKSTSAKLRIGAHLTPSFLPCRSSTLIFRCSRHNLSP